MNELFLDVLTRPGAAGNPEEVSRILDALCQQLASLVGDCNASIRQELLDRARVVTQTYLEKVAADQPPQASANGTEPSAAPAHEGTSGAAPKRLPPPQRPADIPCMELSPEFLESERQTINEAEILAALREIRATGGLELRDFIQELEKEITLHE
jgi:hypothetical protein